MSNLLIGVENIWEEGESGWNTKFWYMDEDIITPFQPGFLQRVKRHR